MTSLPNCKACNQPLDIHAGLQYGWCLLTENLVRGEWEVHPITLYHPRCAPTDPDGTRHLIQGKIKKEDRAA